MQRGLEGVQALAPPLWVGQGCHPPSTWCVHPPGSSTHTLLTGHVVELFSHPLCSPERWSESSSPVISVWPAPPLKLSRGPPESPEEVWSKGACYEWQKTLLPWRKFWELWSSVPGTKTTFSIWALLFPKTYSSLPFSRPASASAMDCGIASGHGPQLVHCWWLMPLPKGQRQFLVYTLNSTPAQPCDCYRTRRLLPFLGADLVEKASRQQVGADRYLHDSNTCGLLRQGECRILQEYREVGERRLPERRWDLHWGLFLIPTPYQPP